MALAIAAAAMPGAAVAADFPASPYYAAPAPYSAYSWAGPYIGGTLGYEWGEVDQQPDASVGRSGRHRSRL